MARLPIERFTVAGDDLVPGFEISIQGKDAKKAGPLFDAIRPLIAAVSYEEDEEMATMFELTVINQPDDQIGRPVDWKAVIDSKAFQEGNAVDLWMGYGGALEFMGRVDIVKWLPRASGEGPMTFTIKGYDGRHKMMKSNEKKQREGKKPRKTFYKGQPDEKIVRKIAEKYGYGVEADRTEVKRRSRTVPLPTTDTTSSSKLITWAVYPTRIQPADMDDWSFLRKLASINRFDLWVDYDLSAKRYVVHFKKRQEAGQAEYLFSYNGNDGSLLEWEPDFAVQEQPTDVEVLFYDSKRKRFERTTISDPNPSEDVKLSSASVGRMTAQKSMSAGARVRFSAFGQVIEAIANRPFRSKKEASKFALDWLRERERDLLLLRGKVVGIETLRPRQIHQFEGMGRRLDGFYRLVQAKHVQAPNGLYVVEFVANKVLSQEVTRRKATKKARTKSATKFIEKMIAAGASAAGGN